MGYASDRLGKFNIAGLATLYAGFCAFFLWIFAGQYYAGLIIYALMGVSAGTLFPAIAPLGAEIVGLPLLPSGLYCQRHQINTTKSYLRCVLALSSTWLFLVPPSACAGSHRPPDFGGQTTPITTSVFRCSLARCTSLPSVSVCSCPSCPPGLPLS